MPIKTALSVCPRQANKSPPEHRKRQKRRCQPKKRTTLGHCQRLRATRISGAVPEAEMTRNQGRMTGSSSYPTLPGQTSIWLLHTLTSSGLPCLTKTPSTPDSIFPPHRDISSSQRCSRGRANNVSTWACLPPAIHNAPASSSTACLVLIDNYPVSGHEVQTIRRTGKAMRLKPDDSQAQNPVIVLVRDDCADTLPPTSLDS